MKLTVVFTAVAVMVAQTAALTCHDCTVQNRLCCVSYPGNIYMAVTNSSISELQGGSNNVSKNLLKQDLICDDVVGLLWFWLTIGLLKPLSLAIRKYLHR